MEKKYWKFPFFVKVIAKKEIETFLWATLYVFGLYERTNNGQKQIYN